MTVQVKKVGPRSWIERMLVIVIFMGPLALGLIVVPRLVAVIFKDRVYAMESDVTMSFWDGKQVIGVLNGPSATCVELKDMDVRSRYNILLPDGKSISGAEIKDVELNIKAPKWLVFLGGYYQQENNVSLDGDGQNCLLKLRWK